MNLNALINSVIHSCQTRLQCPCFTRSSCIKCEKKWNVKIKSLIRLCVWQCGVLCTVKITVLSINTGLLMIAPQVVSRLSDWNGLTRHAHTRARTHKLKQTWSIAGASRLSGASPTSEKTSGAWCSQLSCTLSLERTSYHTCHLSHFNIWGVLACLFKFYPGCDGYDWRLQRAGFSTENTHREMRR